MSAEPRAARHAVSQTSVVVTQVPSTSDLLAWGALAGWLHEVGADFEVRKVGAEHGVKFALSPLVVTEGHWVIHVPSQGSTFGMFAADFRSRYDLAPSPSTPSKEETR